MDPTAIVHLYANPDDSQTAYQYLSDEGVIDADFESLASDKRIMPDYRDLARLHKSVRGRKVFTALEFGVGYSTFVIADALAKNQRDWESLSTKPTIRNHSPFQLFSVDSSRPWLDELEAALPNSLRSHVSTSYSKVVVGSFQDRACHYYEDIPNVVPDFVYLDGPDPMDVQGSTYGVSWQNPDRCVMAGDLLKMEPTLLPGTLIVIDGRTANARFLHYHLYRQWDVQYNSQSDTTTPMSD